MDMSSLVPKRREWIDPRRAARGQVRGREGHGEQQRRGAAEGDGIVRLHAEQLTLDQPNDAEEAGESDRRAPDDRPRALAHDEPAFGSGERAISVGTSASAARCAPK